MFFKKRFNKLKTILVLNESVEMMMVLPFEEKPMK